MTGKNQNWKNVPETLRVNRLGVFYEISRLTYVEPGTAIRLVQDGKHMNGYAMIVTDAGGVELPLASGDFQPVRITVRDSHFMLNPITERDAKELEAMTDINSAGKEPEGIDAGVQAILREALSFDPDTILNHRAWSMRNFGTPKIRGPVGGLKHLALEAQEAADSPSDIMEYADCAFLLIDSLWRGGFTFDDLNSAMAKKMPILLARDYSNVRADEIVEHNRTEPKP